MAKIETIDKNEENNLLNNIDSDRRTSLKSKHIAFEFQEARYRSERAQKLWIKIKMRILLSSTKLVLQDKKKCFIT